ncbi:hypothetical protein K437DRAFT_261617 [Tilletiaria anomala UBC 951]|uniref:Class II aldolase/adducin N-terminal domain-containing protein n=1 Tax=Tilletiaria anomala (strain ATCC 24038 / CBS 436.72 / UBC 951) TaxID=1037660 RepID=A0A066WM30_TILAU|nr:uncharacterized protein K437DRAFT_261617 [Tilletiaria anomala UBC 951]KDN52059.1 hypothetical protein K437DRAFT_261617 [Tilletiaria anomala UBC 951]
MPPVSTTGLMGAIADLKAKIMDTARRGATVFRMMPTVTYDTLEEERTGGVFANDGFNVGVAGHLKYRDPIHKDELVWRATRSLDSYLLALFGLSFDMGFLSDLLLIGLDGECADGRHPSRPDSLVYNQVAFAIHNEVHMASLDLDAGSTHTQCTLPFMLASVHEHFSSRIARCDNFGGAPLASEEGANVAKALGPRNKALIRQNHGILTCSGTAEGAVLCFIAREKHWGGKPLMIGDREATSTFTYRQISSEVAVYFQDKPYFARVDKESKSDYKA